MMARNKKKSIDNGQAPLGGIGINTARVEGVEKRKKPNKHYVSRSLNFYMLLVILFLIFNLLYR